MSVINDPYLWYRDKDSVPLGGVRRYTIRYNRIDPNQTEIYLRLKNIERSSIRAIHLLNGPFILYCHVIPNNYDHREKLEEETREIIFDNQLKPGQSFNVKLLLNGNSHVKDNTYGWSLDILSQIVITKNTSVLFDLMIGSELELLRKLNHGPFKTLTSLLGEDANYIKLNKSFNPQLTITKETDKDLWTRAPKTYEEPVHLIIVTHGIFSNLSADMLYIKETLEANVNDNVLVKGFDGNAGRTEVGLKKLGSRQGKYLMDLINNMIDQDISISKISFIGHSLGGLTQLYSIKFILENDPNFFTKREIQPFNLVFLASPLLGIINEISFLISWLLDLGTLGKTGRDLTLKSKLKRHPILEELPVVLHEFLKSCKNLIIYANIINDGIVPLRTGALLYLDYMTLDNVRDLQQKDKQRKDGNEDDMREIPMEKNEHKNNFLKRYKQLISLNFNLANDKRQAKLESKIRTINARGSDNLQPDENVELNQDEAIRASQDDSKDSDTSMDDSSNQSQTLNIPPKASIIESAINTIICPIPNLEFITDPETRRPIIIHDKYYRYTDLPPEKHENSIFNKTKKQVKIARKYHEDLNWRKVLVKLPADAHNNIAVRRRFPNGYGWPVIDHLCNAFNESLITSEVTPPTLKKLKSKI